MRSFGIPAEIHQYVAARSNPSADPVADDLAAATRQQFPDRAQMNIGDDQGRFMAMFAAAMGATTIIEVGTFTGMSALWLARGLAPGGRLICFDLVDTYTPIANEAWEAAGVADRIELRVGPAAVGLAALPEEPHIDLAFIDADKTSYANYLDLLLPRMRTNGVILVDNVLWSGRVIEPDDMEADTVALRAFNDDVATRADCDAVILTVGDGITMITPCR